MLCAFSRGTQVVFRLIRPVTQTAWAPSWPAERKWKLSGAFSRARRGGAVRTGSGAPSSRARRCQESCGSPRGAAPCAHGSLPRPAGCAPGPGHVDLQAAPPERAPQQGLDLAHRLDPAVGNGLGDRLQQPRWMRTPSGASTAMKAYWPESRRQESPRRRSSGSRRRGSPPRRRRLGHRAERRQRGDGADQNGGDEQEEDRAQQAAGRHRGHGEPRVLDNAAAVALCPARRTSRSSPPAPRPGRRACRRSRPTPPRRTRSSRHQQAGQQGPDDVDRLDATQREAAEAPRRARSRCAACRPRNASGPPSSGRSRRRRNPVPDDEVVGLGGPVPGLQWTAR